MTDGLRRKATRAFGWSFAKSWFNKVFALVVFFTLARVLSPEDLGMAQAILVALAFIGLCSEFGFSAALVQSRILSADDVNLPFLVSLGIGIAASVGLLLFADTIAAFIGAPHAADLLRLAAVAPPLTAAGAILMGVMRRELDFGAIARSSVVGSLAAGLLALVLAQLGWGAKALVVQALVTAALVLVLLWWQSKWRPGLVLRWDSLRLLLPVSVFVFASALLDFMAVRLVDVLIVKTLGVAALGMFAVGSKLYTSMLELMSGTLIDVGASMMAKLRDDLPRLRQAHLKLLFIASCTTSGAFGLLSVVSPELCLLLFGPQWSSSHTVATLLALLGAVQVVQFFNGSLLLAVGRSRATFLLNVAKLSACAVALGLLPAANVGELTRNYVLSQLAVSPLTFAAAISVTQAKWQEVAVAVFPGWLSVTLAWLAATACRPLVDELASPLRLLLLGGVFSAVMLALVLALKGKQLSAEIKAILNTRRPAGQAVPDKGT
jgi:O-antigen/teichoic acid export membrane protein